MLLGFKERFADFVEEGSKTHSIRARRKRAPKDRKSFQATFAAAKFWKKKIDEEPFEGVVIHWRFE